MIGWMPKNPVLVAQDDMQRYFVMTELLTPDLLPMAVTAVAWGKMNTTISSSISERSQRQHWQLDTSVKIYLALPKLYER